MNTDILPRGPLAALYSYWQHGTRLPESDFELLPPETSPVRHLTSTELATIRIQAPDAECIPETRHGVPYQAAIRLAIFHSRGLLATMSGWRAATEMQTVFHPRSSKYAPPMRGVEILRGVDATSHHHGVRVTVGQRIPLSTYCAELETLLASNGIAR